MGRLNVDEHFDELRKQSDFEADLMFREVAGDVALQIKQRRAEMGIGQKELAELLGTNQSRISQLEDPLYGKLTLSTLAKLAPVLKCRLKVAFEVLTESISPTIPEFDCEDDQADAETNDNVQIAKLTARMSPPQNSPKSHQRKSA